ncbi:Arm DNA-binding domain-containing protein [Aquimarina longa]|uniref:Arm DNA-binding domain-containing protein n=1 Tax=Aquimarina longa TaxID=1080221 RepID=UPI0007864526|nr:Arm DNA-binding domain-containing protein [Aquimarina longa]
MKGTIKLYTSDGETDGMYPIKIIVTHKGATTRKTIGHSLIQEWNIKTELPLPSHYDFDDLYPKILDLRKKAITSKFKSFISIDRAINFILENETTNNKVSDFNSVL